MNGAPTRAEQKEWRNLNDTQAILAAGRQALLDVEQGIKNEEKPLPNWRDSVNEDKMNVNTMIRDMNQQLPPSRHKISKNNQSQQQTNRERMKELEREVIDFTVLLFSSPMFILVNSTKNYDHFYLRLKEKGNNRGSVRYALFENLAQS